MSTVRNEGIMVLRTSSNPSADREGQVWKIHWRINKT